MNTANHTAALAELVRETRHAFDSGTTRPLAWRETQLDGLIRFFDSEQDAIQAALRSDLGRSDFETHLVETFPTRAEAKEARKHLRTWAAERPVHTPIQLQPGSSRIVPEPLGVMLIISPWNYPLNLALSPLVAAIAAGNCAVIKPSELAPATSQLLAERLGAYIDGTCFPVVAGGVPETTALLEQRFDHICFTGGARVARIVAQAAARHLTPTTLELGGKSPCIVDRSADINVAAKRIAWGKYLNAGQTCVAPDYVLVERSQHDALVEGIRRNIRDFYGDDPRVSDDYSRIITPHHLERVAGLIDAEKVVIGGEVVADERYIAPTVMTGVSPDDAVMQEEIFGPVLPIIAIDDIDEAVRFVRRGEKPLALYIFTRDAAVERQVLEQTSSGGVAINHTILHLTNSHLPFGGVGESGMGAYHGQWGFDAFSHLKPILKKANWFEPPVAYPPASAGKRRALDILG